MGVSSIRAAIRILELRQQTSRNEEWNEQVMFRREVKVTKKRSLKLELDNEELYQQEKKNEQKIEQRDENDNNSSSFVAVNADGSNLSVDADDGRSNSACDGDKNNNDKIEVDANNNKNVVVTRTEENNDEVLPASPAKILLMETEINNDKNTIVNTNDIDGGIRKNDDDYIISSVTANSVTTITCAIVKNEETDSSNNNKIPTRVLDILNTLGENDKIYVVEYIQEILSSSLSKEDAIAADVAEVNIFFQKDRGMMNAVEKKQLSSKENSEPILETISRKDSLRVLVIKNSAEIFLSFKNLIDNIVENTQGILSSSYLKMDAAAAEDTNSIIFFQKDTSMNSVKKEQLGWKENSESIQEKTSREYFLRAIRPVFDFEFDVSRWNVKNATNMKGMFDRVECFKGRSSETRDTDEVKNICCCSFQYLQPNGTPSTKDSEKDTKDSEKDIL